MSKDSCCSVAGAGHDAGGDGVDAADRSRAIFNRDPVAWLVGQGIRHLNACDADGQHGLQRVIELLRSSGSASATIGQALHDSPQDDHSLRWSLLYLLAQVDEARAAEVFFRAAVERVPSAERYARGCETPRDGEVLVRTMAVAGLAGRAAQDKDAVQLLFKLLDAQPERALRVEVFKALLAVDAHHAERIRAQLPQDLLFALDLKQVRAEVLAVEHEPVTRSDATRRGPELGSKRRAPKSTRCDCC